MKRFWEKVNKTAERNGRAKLNRNQVQKIRRLYKTGKFTHKQLANMFPVQKSAIGRILLGETWN